MIELTLRGNKKGRVVFYTAILNDTLPNYVIEDINWHLKDDPILDDVIKKSKFKEMISRKVI